MISFKTVLNFLNLRKNEPQESTDDQVLQDSQIGEAAGRAAADPEVERILHRQLQLQGESAVNKEVPGASITSQWQGKHAGHPTADFFLTKRLESGKLLVVVGDLSGKGVAITHDSDTGSLALSYFGGEFICKLHEALNSSGEITSVTGPADAIRLIDRIVTESPDPKAPNMLAGKYMVMAAVVIDSSNGTVEASVHGTPPIFIRKPGGDIQVIRGSGCPIGILPIDDVQVEQVKNLSEGTEILIMTDGLTDLKLTGWANEFGLTQRVIDILTPEDSTFFRSGSGEVVGADYDGRQARAGLFSSDRDNQTSLERLVQQAGEHAVDDWGYLRIKL